MIENDAENIICNKCHNEICRESLATGLICMKTVKQNCTFKSDINTCSSLGNNIQEMAESQKTNSYICQSCHVELQQKLHVSVVTDICRNMYEKCTTKWIMTSQILLYHDAYNMYQTLYMKSNIYVHHVTKD